VAKISLLLLLTSVLFAQVQPWDTVKQLPPGKEVRVTLVDGRKLRGGIQSVTDDTLVLTSKSTETLSRATVSKVATKGKSHRGRNALIGLGIGAVGGLAAGVGFDHTCPANGCAFIGKNAGKEVLTPLGALIGVGVGALIPTGLWHDIYRAK
jgi:hypothetical protein